MRATHRAFAYVALAFASIPHFAQAAPPPAVDIDAGPIEGKALPSGVTSFLGIPFAAPPVRELRWRAPRPVASWKSIYHADRLGPQCIQPQRSPLSNQYSGPDMTSEDCLFLNIWAKPAVRKSPVIVFIHGGAFFIGSASMALYDGENVARQGAVFVSLNYRLGALGFLAHPELSAESPTKTSGNYGFLDQIAALKWIQRNIARFGGDPGNVTIAGQSAGSMSVLTLQASPLAKGLFHRAVGMSGAIGGAIAMPQLAAAEKEGVKLQTLLKAADLAALRALPADRILGPRPPAGPSLGPIEDGYVLPQSIGNIFASERQNDVPLLLGFTKDESLGGMGRVTGLDDYRAKAAARYGDRAAKFLALYPAMTDEEARRQARTADRDGTMAVSMFGWAKGQATKGHSRIYSYEFAREHSYAPGVTFSDLDPATAGVYHTAEVPFWFGTLDSFNRFRHTRDWTPADRKFSAAMTASLVAFARTGNPDTVALNWPVFAASAPMLLELGTVAKVAPWPDMRKFDFFKEEQARAASAMRN